MCFELIDVELHSANCVVCLRIIVDFDHNEYSRNRVQGTVTEGQNLLLLADTITSLLSWFLCFGFLYILELILISY